MRLDCALPARVPLNPDTVDFTRFRNRGYIKGLFASGMYTTRLLFALPKAVTLKLLYSKSIIDGWHSNGTYRCQYVFCANRWIRGLDLSGTVQSMDKTGAKVLILDPEHNGGLHR